MSSYDNFFFSIFNSLLLLLLFPIKTYKEKKQRENGDIYVINNKNRKMKLSNQGQI